MSGRVPVMKPRTAVETFTKAAVRRTDTAVDASVATLASTGTSVRRAAATVASPRGPVGPTDTSLSSSYAAGGPTALAVRVSATAVAPTDAAVGSTDVTFAPTGPPFALAAGPVARTDASFGRRTPPVACSGPPEATRNTFEVHIDISNPQESAMTTSRITTQAADQRVLEGISTSMPAPTLPLGKKVYTQSSLAAVIQSRITLANTIEQSRASWLDAVQQYEKLDIEVRQVVRDLRNAVIAAYGADSPKLADFGFKPPRHVVQTPQEKALAAERRKATRAARRTMGKKQRKQITAPPIATPVPTTNATSTTTSG